jgi:hypothetical protein
MYGVPQIGEANLKYSYNEYDNYQYGQMQKAEHLGDLNNQYNNSVYNNGINLQPGLYQNNDSSNYYQNFNNQLRSDIIQYPQINNSLNANDPASKIHLTLNKNVNNDPLSEMFG